MKRRKGSSRRPTTIPLKSYHILLFKKEGELRRYVQFFFFGLSVFEESNNITMTELSTDSISCIHISFIFINAPRLRLVPLPRNLGRRRTRTSRHPPFPPKRRGKWGTRRRTRRRRRARKATMAAPTQGISDQ